MPAVRKTSPKRKKKASKSEDPEGVKSPRSPGSRGPEGDDLKKVFAEFKKPGSEGAIQTLSDLAVTITEEQVSEIREKSSKEGALDYATFKKVIEEFIDQAYKAEEDEKTIQHTKSMHAKGSLDPAAATRLSEPIPKGKETVRVVVRVRPFMPYEFKKAKELNQTMKPVVFMTNKECQLLNTETNEANHSFKFDHCFWSIPPDQCEHGLPQATQRDVYDYTGVPAIKHAFTGFNTCIFAYGQTGSGKTHSMLGTNEDPGIAPRLINQLFDRIQELKDKGEKTKFEVRVCFLEIYNEKVMDLLMNSPVVMHVESDDEEGGAEAKVRRKSSAGKMKKKRSIPGSGDDKYRECKVRFSPDKGTYVEGITRLQVHNAKETMHSMQGGMKYRAVASHSLNATSSRSHAIFQICLKQSFILGTTRVSNINIVDLAGSERIKMTHATGSVLDEAKNINQSLSTLRRVIDTLIENSKMRAKKIPPYRESMLTWVLKDSLGGNSKTVMIAAISPHFSNYDDTLNTLRYALKAKSIVLHAHVNEEQTAFMVNALKKELELLKQQMASGVGYSGDPVELQQAIEELKKTETEAEEFKKRAETEMKIKDEQVKEEKKQRFAAVFRNAFFIEKKRMDTEDRLAAKDKEIQELREELQAVHNEMRNIQDRANEKAAKEALKAQANQDEIERLSEEVSVARRREDELRTEIEQGRVQARRESVRADSFETQVDSLKEEISKLSTCGREEVERMKKEIERLKKVEGDSMKQRMQLAELEHENGILNKKVKQLEEDLAAAKKQIQALQDDKSELRKELAELQDAYDRVTGEKKKVKLEFEREIHIMQMEMEQKDILLHQMKEETRLMREEVDKAVDEKRQSDDAMAAIRLTHTKHQRNLVFRANELEECNSRIQELEKDNSQTKQELAMVQSQLVTKEQALSIAEMPYSHLSQAYSSPRNATSPLSKGMNDYDFKGYIQDKFFPRGDKRAPDANKPSPLDSRIPGERVWVGNGYVYGSSPHRTTSPPRSFRSTSPSHTAPSDSAAFTSPRVKSPRSSYSPKGRLPGR
eukprot:TRINITY_DN16152_c0_g1_i1.p1 TRINITY_DN16152_c0_g1~~TRINITY_DN16152_c0_g1_i1.p1  ORF type:complete len:1050 (+),score=478.38 TRINITY_DN16152_c0_g1_i1:200-3349(+)